MEEERKTPENKGETRNRDEIVDIMKGIGIILMVLRHARAPYSDFVLLFHMAIFFIASGYLYDRKCADTIKSVERYLIRKIKNLYLPYLLYTVIFVVLNNFFLHINVYTDNPAFLSTDMVETTFASLGSYYTFTTIVKQIISAALFQGGTQIGGALWFFQSIFMVLVGYTFVEYTIHKVTVDDSKRIMFQTLVSLILLFVGYQCQIMGYRMKGLNRVCSVYVLIHIGVLLKNYSVVMRIRKFCSQWVTLILALLVLASGYHRGYIALDGNNIENPVFFLVMSVAGWIFLYSIAELLNKVECKFNKGLLYITKYSIPIIATHFLCFKIVNVVAVAMFGMEMYMIAAFPVLITTNGWWVLYTVVGIGTPLLIRKLCVELLGKVMANL